MGSRARRRDSMARGARCFPRDPRVDGVAVGRSARRVEGRRRAAATPRRRGLVKTPSTRRFDERTRAPDVVAIDETFGGVPFVRAPRRVLVGLSCRIRVPDLRLVITKAEVALQLLSTSAGSRPPSSGKLTPTTKDRIDLPRGRCAACPQSYLSYDTLAPKYRSADRAVSLVLPVSPRPGTSGFSASAAASTRAPSYLGTVPVPGRTSSRTDTSVPGLRGVDVVSRRHRGSLTRRVDSDGRVDDVVATRSHEDAIAATASSITDTATNGNSRVSTNTRATILSYGASELQ